MYRVYVAGAFTPKDMEQNPAVEMFGNMRKGIALASKVFYAGYAPFCPWLDFHFILCLPESLAVENLSVDMFYDYSTEWLRQCQAVLLVPGWEKSAGTQCELMLAKILNIPVFQDMEKLGEWADEQDAAAEKLGGNVQPVHAVPRESAVIS